jgi:general nucleoside transport system ATP-binding protein
MWIELRGIHKYYGPIKANCGVNLTILPGTVHGILGENGAGKTTLMKILAGYSRKTRGDIFIDNSPVDYHTPSQAADLGIGMLYQDPLDFPLLTVLENFMLGQISGIRNKKRIFKKIFGDLARSLNFSLRPDTLVKKLTIGERQQLEILRLLAQGVQVLILDEPTTGISGMQKKILFQALRKLAGEDKSVVLVSHKLEDVESVCDKITVMKQGIVSGEMERPFFTHMLLEMMFDTSPVLLSHTRKKPGERILDMTRVSAPGGRTGLRNCSLTVHQGEVVGLAGLEGSGQDVFLRVAAGLKQPSGGSISLRGENMNGKNHHAFKSRGVAYLPGSRLEQGLIPGLNIAQHVSLQDKERGFFIHTLNSVQGAKKCIADFRIKAEPESYVESLSGGNQQRLLLSFLPANPVLLLLDNPTRGLDMESVLWVWEYLHVYSAHQTCLIFSSSELDEILTNADRVLVFFDGAVIKDTPTDQTDAQELGRAIAGRI